MINKDIVSEIPSQSANYVAHPSDSTRTEIDSGIGDILLDASDYNNTKLSKSVIIYNCLMQHAQINYTDGLDDIEDRLNSQLEQENIDVDEMDNLKNHFNGIDLYSNEKKRMQVTLPDSVFDQVEFSRGWGRRIEEAVEHCVQSVYQNRKHRITVKQDILSVIQGRKNIDDMNEVVIQVYNEVVEKSIFDRFDYFGFGELEEHKDKFESKEDKKKALYEVYKNMTVPRHVLQNKFIEIFEYSNKYHAMSIFNTFCADYSVYEYNSFDEYESIDIDFVEKQLNNTKSHDDIDFVVYSLVDKFCESLDENESVDELGQILKNNSIIDDTDDKTVIDYIRNIQEEYGDIENLRSVKHGAIRPVKD